MTKNATPPMTVARIYLRVSTEEKDLTRQAELGQSRAAVINMAIYRAVEHGLIIDGRKTRVA